MDNDSRVFVEGGESFKNPLFVIAVSMVAVAGIDENGVNFDDNAIKERLEFRNIETSDDNVATVRKFLNQLVAE